MNKKAETEIYLYNYLKEKKKFSKVWNTKKIIHKISNKYVQSILDISSKRGTGNRGEPDLIYCNNDKKLLILLENKYSTADHKNDDGIINAEKYAIDGVKHYLSFFLSKRLTEKNKHLSDWRILGIAFSGDITDEYNQNLDTFYIKNDNIENANIKEFLNEEEYIALFESIDLEKITNEISRSSQEINNQLRNLDSQQRPVLLSALMISLLDRYENDFRNNYVNFSADTIADMIPLKVLSILENEEIRKEKIEILLNKISFLKTDIDLRNNKQNLLKDILDKLKNNVIPLFEKKSNYDIIGKFYEEFLKYAGVSNVKKGIVLTPHHITTLFTELIDIKINDIILDPCCGTGAFLIAGMNKIHQIINSSTITNKSVLVEKVKENQLLGFEKNDTMFSLAISNMLFRGDGKSKIFNVDFFSEKAEAEITKLKPTIGFINPPYGGKGLTKKEIQFLEKMLDSVSRYGIIIAPQSTFFSENMIRNRILTKHTLKYVINMPNDLFQPNASTHTAIAVFETHSPYKSKEVIFYDMKEDGFVLSKNKGRTDRLDKWEKIKKDFLNIIKKINTEANEITALKTKIKENDEWLIQAHSKMDYSNFSNLFFENSIKEYIIFKTKLRLNILEKKLTEIQLFNIITGKNIKRESILSSHEKRAIKEWKEFSIKELFTPSLGKPLHKINIKKDNIPDGVTPYVTRTSFNNGIELFLNSSTLKNKEKKGNCITIGAEGLKAFYQKQDFLTGNKINILKNKKLNEYNALFIITILNFIISKKFTYGRAVVKNRLEKENMKIKLPIDKKGKPDWDFMENYIKSLPYSSNI